MTRFFDIIISSVGLIFLIPILVTSVLILFIESRRPIFFQIRVGKNLKPFVMLKFRTMRVDTKSTSTHLVDASCVTFMGRILRKIKFDELPQLWNVLMGDMSLVGPRPCLFNQKDVINERLARDVFRVRPGITGLAQICRIDMSQPKLLAKVDAEMLSSLNLRKYFKYILLTLIGGGAGDRISH